jgi:predicted nucleic acid-binding protein
MVCLDTTFLVDLMRETAAQTRGRATLKMEELEARDEVASTTLLNVAELLVGPHLASDPEQEFTRLEAIVDALHVLPFTFAAAVTYGRLKAEQLTTGDRVGDMDTLIASVVLQWGEPLITANLDEFQRIPGLRVEGY